LVLSDEIVGVVHVFHGRPAYAEPMPAHARGALGRGRAALRVGGWVVLPRQKIVLGAPRGRVLEERGSGTVA
jgi:hypothetical protein